MYFVLKQHQEMGRTFENNVRVGGFRTLTGAKNTAKRAAPAFIRNEKREIVGQTVSNALPLFIA